MSIFDIITSNELATYWELKTQDRKPYIGEELFPDDKKLGLKIEWLKGANGVPVVLKASAFDAVAIPRPRIGVDKLEAHMPFFKESKYIDEVLRQQLNMVLETGNQSLIDTIVNQIFNDEVDLLEGASAQRERMRMMMLTTGIITMSSNGQIYEYDYHMPEEHKVDATKDWSDPTAPIMEDIRAGINKIIEDTGVTPERAVTSSKTLGYMRKNIEIRATINSDENQNKYVSDKKLKQFLADEFSLTVETNDKRYKDETGIAQRYVEEDVFVMFPSGSLGTTWFGTTPEESDLMTSNVANVSIVDTGVAITTIEKADPVNVETKVTMICLPDFPTADQVYIISTGA